MSNKIILKSYAKLNLYLAVLNKRKDNYHNIKTVFERIDLCDRISFKCRPDGVITARCADPAVPAGPLNLCYKSAKLLQDKSGVELGADIKIDKRIPVGAGLGGGSSNAAYTLIGLNKLWKLGYSKAKLARLGRNIGADVPFFIYDTSFALATGRGDTIKPLNKLRNKKLWHILAVPRLSVSTPLIYKRWDVYKKGEKAWLTRPGLNVIILCSAIIGNKLHKRPDLLYNGLEKVTVRLYPEVKRIRERLAGMGVSATLMSGSGPAVFGVVSAKGEVLSLVERLKNEAPSLRVFATATW